MNINQIRIKRMRENAVPPSMKTDGAAGWDLAAAASMNGNGWSKGIKVVNYKTLVPLGWAFEIPPGYVGLLAPRSSRRHQFADGVIDSDYRGEIFIQLPHYTSGEDDRWPPESDLWFEEGERIAQLVIVPVLQVGELVEVDELSDTTRGTGGHGSTGRF